MAFKNRIRLPITVDRPQYKESRDVYRRADGKTIVQGVTIQKIYQGQSDWMPEQWHEAFKIALASDQTTIETDKYLGGVVQNGDYQINWQDRFNRVTAMADFKLEVSPFDATNSNCQTCEEALSLQLEDDDLSNAIYGSVPLNEGSTTTFNIANNDSICCSPAVFSIVYFDPVVVSAISINSSNGELSLTLNSPLSDYNHLKIATYRVTCPNGNYDEADIYADISGSTEGCLAPLGVVVTDVQPDGVTFSWSAPSPAPLGYHYQLFQASNMGAPLFEGDVGGPPLTFNTLLTPGTAYRFFLASLCSTQNSNYVEVDFNTQSAQQGGCGQYSIRWSDPEYPTSVSSVTYMNCQGNPINYLPLANGVERIICMLEYSPGNPVLLVIDQDGSFGHTGYTEINYIGVC